jgi:hypothetical protein
LAFISGYIAWALELAVFAIVGSMKSRRIIGYDKETGVYSVLLSAGAGND